MTVKNTIYGIVSKKREIFLLKCILLINFKNNPNIICITPIMIENFILNEFVYEISLSEIYQIQSIPIGYTQFSFLVKSYRW